VLLRDVALYDFDLQLPTAHAKFPVGASAPAGAGRFMRPNENRATGVTWTP
jgi:hypothetical protein